MVRYLISFLLAAILTLQAQVINELPIEVNNLKTSISNSGCLNEINFEENTVQFSSGFYLNGKDDNNMWGNGVFPSVSMYDYNPGIIDSDPDNVKNKIYVVQSNDPAFGSSWQEWKDAVKQGAFFYDGNNDGIYNPVDLNTNGNWDNNEDKPDLIGDFTAWCVYNDSKPGNERLFLNTDPKGIEIRQTVFGYNSNYDISLSNTIFSRFIIKNTGSVSQLYDSVYFGLVCDPDIGQAYGKDLAASDTALSSVFGYKNAEDNGGYGLNPPAIIYTLLKGPHIYVPGVTFTDDNGNGKYDTDIDTPLDSAKVCRGKLLGKRTITGAKNQKMTSSQVIFKSVVNIEDPDNPIQQRNYLTGGKFLDGTPIVVKDFYAGNGQELGADAGNISPNYMFSGDPVKGEGWLCINPFDIRTLLSSGPFDLPANEEVEILTAYSVGRGISALNSVTAVKNIAQELKTIYNENFSEAVVSVERPVDSPVQFGLSQNYPNPFNSTTTIKFSLPVECAVTINIFNLLGEIIETIKNESQSPGMHELSFDASRLSSGIYFYSIEASGISNQQVFKQIRKMIFLK